MKQAIRSALKHRRNSLGSEVMVELSSVIAQNILSLIDLFSDIRIVGLYSAINSEVDLSSIYEVLRSKSCKIGLPSVDDDMVFRIYDGVLVDGKYAKEPPSDAPICAPEIIVVPLLGFDKSGNRIGYGKGYYDRYIAAARSENKAVIVIGAAFSIQEEPEIPCDSHDQKLDFIVTELGIYKC
jgi:5-formyltetrahydrofolate cyclo-ligase